MAKNALSSLVIWIRDRPASSLSPVNLLEMQNYWLLPRPTKSTLHFNQISQMISCTHSCMKSTTVLYNEVSWEGWSNHCSSPQMGKKYQLIQGKLWLNVWKCPDNQDNKWQAVIVIPNSQTALREESWLICFHWANSFV